jgi:hypothetical protein
MVTGNVVAGSARKAGSGLYTSAEPSRLTCALPILTAPRSAFASAAAASSSAAGRMSRLRLPLPLFSVGCPLAFSPKEMPLGSSTGMRKVTGPAGRCRMTICWRNPVGVAVTTRSMPLPYADV